MRKKEITWQISSRVFDLWKGLNFGKGCRDFPLCCFNIERCLQVEPKLRGSLESLSKPQSSICGHAGFLVHKALDTSARNAANTRKLAGRYVERDKKLLSQDFAGMNRRQRSGLSHL
jgi:hypothetical protein